ncbi:hypothetical protein QT20_00175, partial [Staphylococcus aureus]
VLAHADRRQHVAGQLLAVDIRHVALVEIQAIGDLVALPARALHGDQPVMDLVVRGHVDPLDQLVAAIGLADVERRQRGGRGAVLPSCDQQGGGEEPEGVLHASSLPRQIIDRGAGEQIGAGAVELGVLGLHHIGPVAHLLYPAQHAVRLNGVLERCPA